VTLEQNMKQNGEKLELLGRKIGGWEKSKIDWSLLTITGINIHNKA